MKNLEKNIGIEKNSKICIKCKEEKEFNLFPRDKSSKNGYYHSCKLCIKNKNILLKDYKKIYYQNNKNAYLDRGKTWRDENPNYHIEYRIINKDIILNNSKEFYKNNSEKHKIKTKEWRLKNPEYHSIYYNNNKDIIKKQIKNSVKNRYKNDPLFNLSSNIRALIYFSFLNKFSKSIKTEEILGCTFEEFFVYLENKFEPWMNWGNKGNPNDGILEFNKTWDLDHIVPISNAKTEKDIIRLNHYTNFQPLCSKINRHIKKNKL